MSLGTERQLEKHFNFNVLEMNWLVYKTNTIGKCALYYVVGMITRRCDIDGNWLSPVVACVRKSFENINDKVSRTILLLVYTLYVYT